MDGSGFDSFIILKLGWFCFSVLISKTSKGTMQKNKNKIIYIYSQKKIDYFKSFKMSNQYKLAYF
jgi:hypothetical protein